jgi:2-keto-4-pentenoate hydratase
MLSQKELEKFANKILEDYDNKNPSAIFKDKIKITNEDALTIQSNVARLRENRGEEIIGYKIGCVSKDTQKKMGFSQPACGYLWKNELYKSGI